MKGLSAELDDGEIKAAIKSIVAAIEELDNKFKERDDVVSGVI